MNCANSPISDIIHCQFNNQRYGVKKNQTLPLSELDTMDSSGETQKLLTEEHLMRKYLEDCSIRPIGDFSLNKLMSTSERFLTFPVSTVRTVDILWEILDLPTRRQTEAILLEYAKTSHPIIHEDFLGLLVDFLEHKKKFGSNFEKSLYSKMDLIALVHRLITKRCAFFMGEADDYMLTNGNKGQGGWRNIGTKNQEAPLILQKCLSYDEVKLAALMCLSCPSFFINNGSRTNNGIRAMRPDHEEKGIVLGMVGCRFEKPCLMEFQDMMIDQVQNRAEYGYGPIDEDYIEESVYSNRADWNRIWAKFYGKGYYPTWNEVCMTMISPHLQKPECYEITQEGTFFVKDVYQRRCRLTAEIVLLEANQRGMDRSQKVFLHIVGIGLGLWEGWTGQGRIYLDGFAQALNRLDLPMISDIYFSRFHQSCGGISNGQRIGKNQIKLHFGIRNPHEMLKGRHEGKLAIVTYAGDGNALPGNEFWVGRLSASGNPAQAASSQIAELQNPHINPSMSGYNVRIASPSMNKLATITEYLDWRLSDTHQQHQLEEDSKDNFISV